MRVGIKLGKANVTGYHSTFMQFKLQGFLNTHIKSFSELTGFFIVYLMASLSSSVSCNFHQTKLMLCLLLVERKPTKFIKRKLKASLDLLAHNASSNSAIAQ